VQDTPDNSMFSFQIGIASQEEMQSSAESLVIPEDVKAKLQAILSFLNQDIGQLVQDAEPIRVILKTLGGQHSEPIEEALIPAAQKRLTDRLQHKQIIKQRDDLKGLVDSTCDQIDLLNQSLANLEKTKGE